MRYVYLCNACDTCFCRLSMFHRNMPMFVYIRTEEKKKKPKTSLTYILAVFFRFQLKLKCVPTGNGTLLSLHFVGSLAHSLCIPIIIIAIMRIISERKETYHIWIFDVYVTKAWCTKYHTLIELQTFYSFSLRQSVYVCVWRAITRIKSTSMTH